MRKGINYADRRMTTKLTQQDIQEFWQQHSRFLKTNLVTESANPLTANLSAICRTDLTKAFDIFKQVELNAIMALANYTHQIAALQQDIWQTIHNGHTIYLIGCGSSGRLAILLTRLYRLYNPQTSLQVIGINSGGDVALVKSIEQFEDNPNFGIKQLLQQKYTKNDLVIGLTASGESPFITKAVEYAAHTNPDIQPWLVFNNPANSLLERNPQHIINNPDIKLLALDVGSMALTGSTRLQATTAMQIALGIALCNKPNPHNNNSICQQIEQIYQLIQAIPLTKLSGITALEKNIVAQQKFILYQTNDALLGLSLLADTTERAPTFNLPPFENMNSLSHSQPSPFYISMLNTSSANDAWQMLLAQPPLYLNWVNYPETTAQYINGFDLSATSKRSGGEYLPNQQYGASWLLIQNKQLQINLDISPNGNKEQFNLLLPDELLQRTLVYKLLLNSHSTLMMGALDYFEGNMMLSLNPSNFKLIDRAIRYSQFILKQQHNITLDYNIIAETVFKQIQYLKAGESIVKKVIAIYAK